MSVPGKSLDKNKRYAGVKANDFVNKNRPNDNTRTAARPQGWANLGKVSGRRIPPPANLPSLKSETGTGSSSFDPTLSNMPTGVSHGWTAGNQTPTGNVNTSSNTARPLTPSKQPTQQQLDAAPALASSMTPPPPLSSTSLPSEGDKPRAPPTWSTITAGTGGGSAEPAPNLLGLNDFPRLATHDSKNRKSPSTTMPSQSDSPIGSTQGPIFRPANLASWKEGGGRVPPMPNDATTTTTTTPMKDTNDSSRFTPDNLTGQNLSSSIQAQILSSSGGAASLLQQQQQQQQQQQMQTGNGPLSYMRPYPPPQQQQQQQQQSAQMWAYPMSNSYGPHAPYGTGQPPPLSMHQLHQRVPSFGGPSVPPSLTGPSQMSYGVGSSQSQQRLNSSTDYKTPSILRNKDIDDLSKLTDNVTWASASQEVNYEEKIRFSDDEDTETNENNNNKTRRPISHQHQHQQQGYYNQQQQQAPSTARQHSSYQSRYSSSSNGPPPPPPPQVLQNTNRPHSLYTSSAQQQQQQQSSRSRLLQEDEHVKQLQDDKNSELMNTLSVAKQRRDEQERNLRSKPYDDSRSSASHKQQQPFNGATVNDESKQIPGYQTRPLLTSTGQDTVDSTSLWQTSGGTTSSSSSAPITTATNPTSTTALTRIRHDTADSQSFTMRSWSDQMESFNYASLHDKAGGGGGQLDNDRDDENNTGVGGGPSTKHEYSRSQSESSSQSQVDAGTTLSRSKHFPTSTRRPPKSTSAIQSKLRQQQNHQNIVDYWENDHEQQQQSNADQWVDWEEPSSKSRSIMRGTEQQDSDLMGSNRYNRQQQYPNERRNQPTSLLASSQTSNRYNNNSNEQVNDYNRKQQQQQYTDRNQQLRMRNNRGYQAENNKSSQQQRSTKSQSNESKSANGNKTQAAWRLLSPTRPSIETSDPTPQEAISVKTQQQNDRRPTELYQRTGPNERKQRYAANTSSSNTTGVTSTINTASIPPLMSVRSDATVKNFKNINSQQQQQQQRQDYGGSGHYGQRTEFYTETNDGWGNDDEYYDEETGYYDPSGQTHRRHHQMAYQSHMHHRGFTTLGSYGRYRRGGTLRHQQQYAGYGTASSGTSLSLNTSTGARSKKHATNRTTTGTSGKKSAEQPTTTTELSKTNDDETKTKKESELIIKESTSDVPPPPPPQTTSTDVPATSSTESTNDVPVENEKSNETTVENVTSSDPRPASKNEAESSVTVQPEAEPSATTATTSKKNTSTQQRRANKEQQQQQQQAYHQDQRYQTQQQLQRYRNTYGNAAHARTMQEYEAMQMAAAQNYYGGRRSTRGRNSHLSGGYYYEHPQQRYNNQHYQSQNDHYQQQQQMTRSSTHRNVKRGSSTFTDRQQQQQQQQQLANGSSNNARHHSTTANISDNDQKEGEEWETASESSVNMRNGHHDGSGNSSQQQQSSQIKTNLDAKNLNRDRTPPKKSFSSQRPLNSRYNENRRQYNSYDRGGKTIRTGGGNRTNRLSTNKKQSIPQNNDEEILSSKGTANGQAAKKEQHRHSVDGYDLNNVAGVVKIETLPAGALEEESTAFDDGGEEFCVVMSKRGRKEQKAAQLSKQNAAESSSGSEQPLKSAVISSLIDEDEQGNEKSSNDINQTTKETSSTRIRNGKSVPPRFNSKSGSSSTRQHGTNNDEHKQSSTYYYDQSYYYYDQNHYYDNDGSYYGYGNYSQSHGQNSRRKPHRRNQQQHHDGSIVDDHGTERKSEPKEKVSNSTDGPLPSSSSLDKRDLTTPSNVMTNIQMWDPHSENTPSGSSKLIEKPTHDRQFASSSTDVSLPHHHQRINSPVRKSNETLARTIKPPPVTDNKTDRDNKAKSASGSTSYEKNDTMSSLGSNQLFEKSTFLDYDDKQSIGTVGDDYNQKINSLKTIWDITEHAGGPLEQTINSMVAMQQKQQHHQENNVQQSSSTTETIPTSSSTVPGNNPPGVQLSSSSTSNNVHDDVGNTVGKGPTSGSNLQPTGSSSNINPSQNYAPTGAGGSNKNEPKNICTVKPTQQVAPNIQDQVDVSSYQTFAPPPLPPQPPLQQQHLFPQPPQANPLHQQHPYPFYGDLLPPQPPQQQQQHQFNRGIYPSTNSNSPNSEADFSGVQSSIYPPQNFAYRNTNVYMQAAPPSVPNTNSMYHHTSQGPISAPPQNNSIPPPMANYPSSYLVDHGGQMISQPQPPPPPTAYMNNQMIASRSQGTPYYGGPPQQPPQTQPVPPYGTQDPSAHAGYYQAFFAPPNSSAPSVGHPSPHNLYGQGENFHPAHPHAQMFARGGSIDRGDHPLMSQPSLSHSVPPPSRPTSYPPASNQQQQQQQPPSLLAQKPFHAVQQQQTPSSNQPPLYSLPNQYGRQQQMPIGAMNTNNNRQQQQQPQQQHQYSSNQSQTQQMPPSLMSMLGKNFGGVGGAQVSFPHRQSFGTSQSNNNRPPYQQQPQPQQQQQQHPFSGYSNQQSKPSGGPTDDNIKSKHM